MYDDNFYMQQALEQAALAYTADEVPIGAIIVNTSGEIVARAYNKVEKSQTQTAHAEMLALAQAGNAFGDWRLEGYTIYVTLEPCSMCMSAILMSRLAVVVFAVPSKLFGFSRDSCITMDMERCSIIIKEGACRDEAVALLQSFFKRKREENRERKKTGNE